MVIDKDVGPRLFRGARVRMSQLGRDRHPKYGYREGVIVGRGSPSSWRVKFDERTTIQAIHRDYLELAVSRQVTAASDGGVFKMQAARLDCDR